MKVPLISIALCTYNGEQYLREQLDTLVDQTYKNLEIIIVDDCSTDSTMQILEEYAEQYINIKVYQNKKNLGYIKNFEKALSLCLGEYIAMSDQDDSWALNKIEYLVGLIKDNQLIYHDSELIDENGHNLNCRIFDYFNFISGSHNRAFLYQNSISGHAMMFSKDLKGFLLNIPSEIIHDQWIAYVASTVGKITYSSKCLVKYRQHTSSSTNILNQKREGRKKNKQQQPALKIKRLLAYLAFPSNTKKDRSFLSELVSHYKAKQKKYFSANLFWFLFRNRNSLFILRKKSGLSRLFFILKECI